MLIRMLVLCLCYALWLGPAWGATYYVKTTGNDSTGDGSNGNPWLTVQKGLRSLSASDILNICAGSYTISGVYGNVASDKYGGGAASWATATTIKNCDGDTFTLTHDGLNMDHSISTGGISYIIFTCDVLTRCNYRGSGGADQSGFRLNNAAHHVRFERISIRSFTQHGIQGGTGGCPSGPANIEILNSDISLNGDDNNHFEHGIYPSCGSNWLIDGNSLLANMGYGIHLYSSSSNYHMNHIVRNNYIEGRKTGATSTAYGIMIATGSNHKIYNNRIKGLGAQAVKLTGCIQHFGPMTAPLDYNNTCYDVTTGVEVGDSGVSAAEIKNNIFETVTTPVSDAGTSTVRATNFCDSAGTGCSVTGDPSFADTTTFALQAGSTARDAGTDLSATVQTDYLGTTRCQGSACDIGAYEYLASVAVSGSGGRLMNSKGLSGIR